MAEYERLIPGGLPIGAEVVIDTKHPKAQALLQWVGIGMYHVTSPRFVGPYHIVGNGLYWWGHGRPNAIPAYTVAADVGGTWNIPAELIIEANPTTVILGTLEEEGA